MTRVTRTRRGRLPRVAPPPTPAGRVVGLAGAVAIGIGGMVGGGIFAVLGEAVALGRGGTPVAFALGGVVASLTAYSYARLSVAHPSRGGTITFIDVAFGRNLLSGSANLLLWLSYLVTIALYAIAFGSYAATFLPQPVSAVVHHLLVSAAIVVPAAVNIAGAGTVSRLETIVVVLKLVLLGVVIAAGASGLDPVALAPGGWGDPLSLVVAGMVVFVAYEGFELIANAAEDVRDPARTLPRAFALAVGIVVVLYVLVAAVTVSTVSPERIAEASDYALAVAAEPSLGHAGFVIVAVAAVLATLSAVNATIYGNARLGYILARDGELPASQAGERGGVPVAGTLTVAAVSLVLANTVPLESVAVIASASFLLVFTATNAAAARLAPGIGARPLVVRTATVVSAVALLALLWHAATATPAALLVLVAFLAVAVGVEAWYGRRVRGHFLGRRYGKTLS
jgi:amino acid transporter